MLFTYVCGTEGRGTRSHTEYAGYIIHQCTWHIVFGGERWKICETGLTQQRPISYLFMLFLA